MPNRHLLVLDTSVVLNLLASGDPARVLDAIDATCVVTPQVVGEVTREPAFAHQKSSLRDLLRSQAIGERPVAGEVLETFVQLASAPPPDGLGDGEASSIATAEALGCEAVIDERKATRIALVRRPSVAVRCTVSLYQMAHHAVTFPPDEIATLLFNALKYARMRVPFDHGKWVVDHIGVDRARECPSMSAVMRALLR